MATFVLVPGSWQGGWAFDPVTEALRAGGHTVHPVTLAGLEPVAPPGTERTNLADHIAQVVALLREACAEPVVLCGHSYGGMIITGVADAVPELVDRLVYIDAYLPRDGESCWMLTTDRFRDLVVRGCTADGRLVAVPDGADPRSRPHPVAAFLQGIPLSGNGSSDVARTFVSGGPWRGSPFVDLAARLTADPAWTVHDIPVGHDIMNRAPAALTAALTATD